MKTYLQLIRQRGNLDLITMSITEDSIGFHMYKDDIELSHTYKCATLNELYDPDFALRSDLEQMAVDLLKAWRTNGKHKTEEKGRNTKG